MRDSLSYRGRLQHLIQGSRAGVRDVVVSMLPQIVRVSTGLISSALLARGLGPAGLGQFALVSTLSETVAHLSDPGVGQAANRYASRAAALGDRAGHLEVMRWSFRLRLLLVLVVGALFFALAPVLAERLWQVTPLAPLLRLGVVAGAFGALAAVPMIYFMSLRQFGMNAAIATAQALIWFGGVVLLYWMDWWSVSNVVITLLVTTAAGALLFYIAMPRSALVPDGGAPGKPRGSRWRAFWRNPASGTVAAEEHEGVNPDQFTLYYTISTLLSLLILRMDIWMMGVFLDESQIGHYSAALRFTLPLTIVLNAILTALWPRVSAQVVQEQSLRLLARTFKVGLLLAGGGVLYSLAAPLLAPWLFGEAFMASIGLGQLLCLRFSFAILVNPFQMMGYSFGLVRPYALLTLLQLALVLLLNVHLLPRVGPAGAVLALIASDVAGFSVTALLIRRRLAAGS
jgi:O-antigen/teichoic acid export membrane protein